MATFSLAASVASKAQDQDAPEELAADLVHSDVPLWSFDHPEFWPRSFSNDGPELEFGCTSKVAFGDWQISTADPALEQVFDEWVRLRNYGVFHCALVEQRDERREHLAKASFEYSWFARIGETKVDGRTVELWALQIGTRAGSNYVLLARTPSEDIVKEFTVLQRKCPKNAVRRGPNMDVWKTEYCAINSKVEMFSLAKRMARLAPMGTMRWIGNIEEPENDD